MEFPAIDICNLSPYDYDKTIDLYNDLVHKYSLNLWLESAKDEFDNYLKFLLRVLEIEHRSEVAIIINTYI